MSNVINRDGSPHVPDPSVQPLWDAIALLSVTNTSSGTLKQKKELQEAVNIVETFISQINLRANLITGNYEAGLKMVAPIFSDSGSTLNEPSYQSLLIALLARLKRQNKIQWKMYYVNIESQKLNKLVDQYVTDN